MAKKEETSKVVLERTYIIPLRKETLKVPFYRKAEKAIIAVKEFARRHMKSENVSLGKYLNLKIWQHGMKNPPGKIKVVITKDDKGLVLVELFDAPKEQKVEEKKPSKKVKGKEDVKDAEFKEIEQKAEEKKEEKAAEAKIVEKEELKEMQKESKEHSQKKHAPKQVSKEPKQIPQNQVGPKHL